VESGRSTTWILTSGVAEKKGAVLRGLDVSPEIRNKLRKRSQAKPGRLLDPMTTEEHTAAPISPAFGSGGPRLHVVLVEPEIAANAGAIGRTCVAAGAMLWLVRPLGFHLDDRHRRRAGLDYWEHLSLRVVDRLDEVVAALGPDRLWSFSTKGRRSYAGVAFAPGDALVFGAESRGLPGHWLAASATADRLVRIPIRPEARSLNLANAVAIGLFEAVRQVDA
jgi:tRNA (cytidine/uridine-2'-O-)-methyltransferase